MTVPRPDPSASGAATGDGTRALRVKLCGMTRTRDAAAAARAGADLIGAVLVPESPRRVSVQAARELGRAAGLPLVLVVADLSEDLILEAAGAAGAAAIQLHGRETASFVRRLRDRGDWELWKALRVRTPAEIRRAVEAYGEVADMLLLDAWHPTRLGGTGTRFPWHALEAVRSEVPGPLRLGVAGGLTPDNVGEAVRRLGPHLVDVSSGVERAPGRKDPKRMAAFVEAARSATRGRGDENPTTDGVR